MKIWLFICKYSIVSPNDELVTHKIYIGKCWLKRVEKKLTQGFLFLLSIFLDLYYVRRLYDDVNSYPTCVNTKILRSPNDFLGLLAFYTVFFSITRPIEFSCLPRQRSKRSYRSTIIQLPICWQYLFMSMVAAGR
jgi:hypothetical protein